MNINGKEISKEKIHRKLNKYFNLSRDFLFKNIFRQDSHPYFIIIGVQKSGTSALEYYLSQHNSLQAAYIKEVGFFNTTRYSYGIEWYSKQFPSRLFKTKYFEATPDYLYNTSFASRAFKHYPELRMVIILRDPVDRAYSAWNMFKEIHASPVPKKKKTIANFIEVGENKKSSDNFISFLMNEDYPDFNTYIKNEIASISKGLEPVSPSFVRYGIYHEQLKRLLEFYSSEQILIIENNELKNSRIETLKKVCDFLNVSNDIAYIDLEKIGTRKYIEPMAEVDKKILSDFYKPHNKELFDMLGKKYNWK